MARPRRTPDTERPDARPGTRLAVRLERTTPWAAQRGVSYFVGLVCTGFAALLALQMARHWPQVKASESWGIGAFVVVFGLAGLLAVYAGIHQLLASRVPETIVEADRLEVGPGETMQVSFQQPGPVVLRSLRATLVRQTIVHPTEQERRRSETARDKDFYEFYQTFLDARDLEAPRGGVAEVRAELAIPPGARPTGQHGRESVRWLVEVWGRVHRWPGFMHQYEVIVVEQRRRRGG